MLSAGNGIEPFLKLLDLTISCICISEHKKDRFFLYAYSFHLLCIGLTVEQGMTDEQANHLNHYLCDDFLQIDDARTVVSADRDVSLSTSMDQVRFIYNMMLTVSRFFLFVM